MIREYESLALIFNFITVDAEQSIGEQHRQIRELFREGATAPVVRTGMSMRWPNGCVSAAGGDERRAKPG